MTNSPMICLEIGDPLPAATLIDPAGGRFPVRGTALAGSPMIILASPGLNPQFAEALRQFHGLKARLDESGIRFLPVSGATPSANAEFAASQGFGVSPFSDIDGTMLSAIGMPAATDPNEVASMACLIVDCELRLLARLPIGHPAAYADAGLRICQDFISSLPHGTVEQQAPVLLVPRVLSPEICRSLIEQWALGNKQTDVATAPYGLDPTSPTDPAASRPIVKRRSDWLIPDGPLNVELRDIFRRRVVLALRKAFDFQPEAYETLRVGCYDAERGGYFRRHRDNVGPPEIRRRRFAMSLNLNDDYEGGEVRFPEYGAQRYRPPMGAALLFSCGLLHEALEIRRGQRFVLLTFFFGKEPAPPSS
ncbi:MAG: 2OG-Fe(II) oxygenase family protein [Dongiaceae bacterium]